MKDKEYARADFINELERESDFALLSSSARCDFIWQVNRKETTFALTGNYEQRQRQLRHLALSFYKLGIEHGKTLKNDIEN